MAKRWEELPARNGIAQWKLTVTSDTAGVPVSVFRGTREQITDALADSQEHANQRLAELRSGNADQGGSGTQRPLPPRQPLSPEQRMQTVAELNDPANVDKAVLRIMESAVGPMENLRQATENAPAEREERSTRAAVEAAERFAAGTPEWHPTEHNKSTLVGYMRTQGLSPSNSAHYTQAFEALVAAQLLQPRPDEDETQPPEPQPERNAPAPALPRTPARTSTGFRSSDTSGQPPRPANRLKYSREQIANMSAGTYKRLMTTDPELTRCAEFYAQQDAGPKRRTG